MGGVKAPAVTPAARVLAAHGLAAKKSWGQNFLHDEHVLAQIALETGAGPGRPVVELGAGLGALTRHLVALGGPVVAVERDRDLVPLLCEAFAGASALTILEADAASLDWAELAAKLGGPVRVVGNLPYQIASRIVVSLADAEEHVASAVVMVQREVAERLSAAPGSRSYGLLSVLVQRAFMARLVRLVPPAAFHPRPKVVSAVVALTRKAEPLSMEQRLQVAAAARAGFSARRKTLRNALAGGLGAPTAAVEEALGAAGLDAKARAETLSVAEFARLGAALAARGLS